MALVNEVMGVTKIVSMLAGGVLPNWKLIATQ